ncbi:MAG: GNAT family N-acetyltransferase [Pyrinomonadaceae bacterium]
MEKENPVRDNKREQRFEMTLDDGKTAFIRYEAVGAGVLALTHTEVPEEFEGKGIGGALVKKTFEIIREENLKIVPSCRFVAVYLKRHPEYQSLVASTSE